jgi:hypothetical protein
MGWNIHPPVGQGAFKYVVFLLQNNKNNVSSTKYRNIEQNKFLGYVWNSVNWNVPKDILVITLGSVCNLDEAYLCLVEMLALQTVTKLLYKMVWQQLVYRITKASTAKSQYRWLFYSAVE